MKKALQYIVICIIAGALNYGICWFMQQVLGVPLYFDTVMVMAILFSIGLWPAIGTLAVHYFITVIRVYAEYKQNTYLFLYFIPGFAIVLVTWLFSRRREKLHGHVNSVFLYILIACFCATIASAITGGIVNYLRLTCFEIQDSWNGQFMVSSINESKMGLLMSMIMGRIPVTSLDRIITTYSGFGICVLYKKIAAKKGLPYEE